MRVPALLSQCLPRLVTPNRGSHSTSSISEGDLYLPSPAIEIIPSKTAHPYKYAGENVDLHGLNMFKGRVSVADIIGFNGLEMISSNPDGGYLIPVNVLKQEIRHGQLSFRGKRVLEENICISWDCLIHETMQRSMLGCSYGLPWIFSCLKPLLKYTNHIAASIWEPPLKVCMKA